MSMGSTQDIVRGLLRSSEELKVAFEALLLPSSGSDEDVPLSETDLRILAVVSNSDEYGSYAERSAFIFNGVAKELNLQYIFPINDDFSISIGQMKHSDVDSGASSTVAESIRDETGFTLTMSSGNGIDLGSLGYAGSLSFFTRNVADVLAMSQECKESKERIAYSKTSADEDKFQWVLPYVRMHDLPADFGISSEDLRLSIQPLSNRFSRASAGTSGSEIWDFQVIQHDWLRKNARASSRRGKLRLKLRLGTFNVNGQMPSQDLSGWIGGMMHAEIPPMAELKFRPSTSIENSHLEKIGDSPFTNESNDGLYAIEHMDLDQYPDLLVLGFQELDLSAEALIYSTTTSREDAWCKAIFAGLGDNAQSYEKMVSKQLVGMLVIVIVKKTLSSSFGGVRTAAAGAGILGIMGNKGGTAVQLVFRPSTSDDGFQPGPTTLTFVNSHLAPFDEMFEKRNSDFQDISKKLHFHVDAENQSPLTVYESDALFWMGDLNYRIDLPDADVRAILNSKNPKDDFRVLFNHDQLKKAIENEKAFNGFSEDPIAYFPTYRFHHTIATDGLNYDLRRKPAWTDRILHMSGPNVSTEQLSYKSCPRITMSDHKPVSADFFVEVDLFDEYLHRAVAKNLLRSLDFASPSYRPTIHLECTTVELGEISFGRASSQMICFRNCGQIPCATRFVPKDPGAAALPEWLRIEPMHSFTLPGEVINLRIVSKVDGHMASKLNVSRRELEATLILRCITGRDHFITVAAKYQPTCFANSLSLLARLPGPIRSIHYNSLATLGDQHPLNAPKEFMRLINWLMSANTQEIGGALFVSPGDDDVMNTIRECLDTGEEFPFSPQKSESKVATSFASVLLLFFSLLPEPIVPEHLYTKCTQVTSRNEAFALLDDFPPILVNVWISLTAFLHFICSSKDESHAKPEASRIAAVMAPVLFSDNVNSPNLLESPLGKRKFLLYFIS